ncbi:hypothetical protein VTN00DRAFT_3139 [Thermoascus crustaceus]|uniref:uncharacterized protein n=1 Tax=Thermoascus crustaceus TaxID=5088 RepID=UPI00374210D4
MEDDEEWAKRQQQQGGIGIGMGMRGMEGRVSHASLPDFYCYIEPERSSSRTNLDLDSKVDSQVQSILRVDAIGLNKSEVVKVYPHPRYARQEEESRAAAAAGAAGAGQNGDGGGTNVNKE